MALSLAFGVLRPPATPGPLERDFEAYYSAGVTADRGGDPYSRAIWESEARVPGVDARRDELLPYVGPPAFLPFWSLLARLPYRAALGLWTAILLAAAAAIVACALRLGAAAPTWRVAVTAAGLGVAAAPMVGALALGQAALLAAAGVAVSLVTYRARKAGAALGATLLAAIQPNLALLLTARMRSGWDFGVGGAAAAVFAAAAFAYGGGMRGLAAYAHRLATHGAAERFITIQYTPAAIAYAFGATPAVASAAGTLLGLAAIACTAGVIARRRLDATTAGLVACAALPLAVPFFHEHDFVIEVLPLLVLALRAQGRPRTLAAVAAAMILVDWFGLAQRAHAQGQIVALGFAVCWAFVALAPGEAILRRRDLAGCAALLALASVAVPLGLLRPAPTWPDTLPAHYRADARLDASEVWADESRVAGLAAREPAWGALRAIPLVGCVVLGAALVADARRRGRFMPPAAARRQTAAEALPV